MSLEADCRTVMSIGIGEIRDVLGHLTSQPLSGFYNVLVNQSFLFGTTSPSERIRGQPGSDVLDVDCPWRIVRDGCILVSSSDIVLKPDSEIDAILETPQVETRDDLLYSVLGKTDEQGLISEKTACKIVERISIDSMGDLEIHLTDRLLLQTFAERSEVAWILYCYSWGWSYSCEVTNGGAVRFRRHRLGEGGEGEAKGTA